MPLPSDILLHFTTRTPLAIAACIGGAAILVLIFRRARFGFWPDLLLAIGTLLLILAAGQPYASSHPPGRVAVMIDNSVSTRGASFHDPDLLKRRIAEMLGDTPYTLDSFDNSFTPPPADAILLFSSGQFTPPPSNLPPIDPVLDPSLEAQSDAAITQMQIDGDQLQISVANNGPPRTLTIHGTLGSSTETIQSDETLFRRFDPTAKSIWAELSGGDLWPENDRASIRPPAPIDLQRWWVGSIRRDNWRTISPSQLPTDPAEYLSPKVIVLDDAPASAISLLAQERLQQYVRDLGGSVVILGGDHAFASGGYDGTSLDAISPLASSPPAPRMRWLLLADASGSMSADDKWSHIVQAMVQLLPTLPPNDPVRIGQFSDSVRWWSDELPAKEMAKLPLPPADAIPHGPTNLEPALDSIGREAPKGMPTQLLLLTDAEVEIDDPTQLSQRLSNAGIHLNLLAIERGSGLPVLEQIVHNTGGAFLTETDASAWPHAAQIVCSAALADRLHRDTIQVHFLNGSTPPFDTQPWNRLWLKPTATLLASGMGDVPMIAQWQYGLGRVIASACGVNSSIESLIDSAAQAPSDPRIRENWQTGPILNVTVDAGDEHGYLNNLNLSLHLGNSPPRSIPQTGPGLYQLQIQSPPEPEIATIWMGNRRVGATALAGWYAPQFAHVGEDRAALEQLAKRTGGQVISPDFKQPISFPWPAQRSDRTSWFAAGGAVFLLMGLVLWKLAPVRSSSPRPVLRERASGHSPRG